jgi:hypothetical protein
VEKVIGALLGDGLISRSCRPDIQPVCRIRVIRPPTILPRVKGMVVILSPACSVPLLEMNMLVPTLEMRNGEAIVRANTEARIKNIEEKANLTMVILWSWLKEHVLSDFIPTMAVT